MSVGMTQQNQASLFWNSVFTKTSKGRLEITQRSGELSSRQRSILIMLDGSKKLDALLTPVAKNELQEIVHFLSQQDFIEYNRDLASAPSASSVSADSTSAKTPTAWQPDAVTPAVPTPVITPEVTVATVIAPTAISADKSGITITAPAIHMLDEASLRSIKDFMTVTAQTYLGLLGADVIRRVERAEDHVQLMGSLGHWHMALRDSKQGHRFASVYMEQVSAALRGDLAALELLSSRQSFIPATQ
ncbi:hypothetical protein ACO0LB_04585 [Undibacterium sp. SXout7W]|uniref:hypothetical protein n=1 Tax=Undibacterium sp. SXout7W TaxID=3413049 RepID=UPI003BF3A4A8